MEVALETIVYLFAGIIVISLLLQFGKDIISNITLNPTEAEGPIGGVGIKKESPEEVAEIIIDCYTWNQCSTVYLKGKKDEVEYFLTERGFPLDKVRWEKEGGFLIIEKINGTVVIHG